MRGEIGINIRTLNMSHDCVVPFSDSAVSSIDLRIIDTNEESLWICGENNDWGYLMTDALIPILKYGYEVERKIDVAMKQYDGDPEVILVGKNEYRSLDILQKIRICKNAELLYKGIPIVSSSKSNGIELFGHQYKKKELDNNEWNF